MAFVQTPSFDNVPASAAPSKHFTSLYTATQRSQSPGLGDLGSTTASRLTLDPPYEYAASKTSRGQDDMNRSRGTRRDQTSLPPLQAPSYLNVNEQQSYEAIVEDDPSSYDLVAPGAVEAAQRSTMDLEKQTLALFSKEHLQVIFGNPSFLLRFTSFLGQHKPQSVPILVHYLDSLKAIRAVQYANAILEGLDEVPGLDFTKGNAEIIKNDALLDRANKAFDHLVQEELPAFVAHEYIQVVSASISLRISGMLAPYLREASEGLAEVFCLTDPSRPDNPIVFASEEFNRTTQYGMTYVLGRNCRFLQGPHTSKHSVRRIRDATKAGQQHQEVFLNYRRDGSPFVNLLLTAPLCDARGVVRYYIGAQVDVTGLVRDCSEMESLAHLLDLKRRGETIPDHHSPNPQKNDELRELAEMLNAGELSTIYKHGGRMHRDAMESDDDAEGSVASNQPRLLLKDPDTLTPPHDASYQIGDPSTPAYGNIASERLNAPGSVASSSHSMSSRLSGRLSGIYNNYLLIRPYPSLRILFASPSQRIPGILQSPFMSRIGGSNRVRDELTAALADGRGVTAKVRWVTKHDEEGRNKWIHCTPLVGVNGQIGVWMIVIVDDERHRREKELAGRLVGGRHAPPIATPERYVSPAPNNIWQAGSATGIPSSANAAVTNYGQQGLGNAPLLPNRSDNGYSTGNGPVSMPIRNQVDEAQRQGSMNSFSI